MTGRPRLHLLCGLPGSGKSTHAKRLESAGVVRISVDEMMLEAEGRLGIDYDRSEHNTLLEPIVARAAERVVELLSAGCDVVLDHGLGRRSDRDDFKRMAEEGHAEWTLWRFDAEMSTLRARCQNRLDLPGTVPITAEILDHLAAIWEPPSGEGEIVVVTD